MSFVPRDEKNQTIHTLHGYKPLPMWVIVLVSAIIIIAAGAPGLLDYLGGPRLTVFGPLAARVAVLALAATTLCASILLTAAYGAAGRAWAAELSKILYQGTLNSRTRFSLFALLVSELSLFGWIAAGAVLCAFASVGIVYLYPIEADTLLILNLVILVLAGVMCAYLAVVFERGGVLSNIVCNRPQKAEISIGLFSFIASPFIALAAAIALIEIPGVVDWAGGLFVMMRSVGIHP